MRERADDDTSPGVVLWTLIRARLRDGAACAKHLRGVIQFELGDAHHLAYVELDGRGARCGEGFAPTPSAWVTSGDAALSSLATATPVPGALGVIGDVELVRAFFAALKAAPLAGRAYQVLGGNRP